MNKLTLIAVVVGIAFSTAATAQKMSNTDYKAGKAAASSEYKKDKADCKTLAGNPKDVCIATAKGKEQVAKADLEAAYKPTPKNHYKARVAKAEADYDVSREKCNSLAGNAKDVCVKEAQAAETSAKADAKVHKTTTDANATASEKSAEARSDAGSKAADARKDAAADKTDANYAVAKEKCDTFAGGAKDRCLDQAKINFGKK